MSSFTAVSPDSQEWELPYKEISREVFSASELLLASSVLQQVFSGQNSPTQRLHGSRAAALPHSRQSSASWLSHLFLEPVLVSESKVREQVLLEVGPTPYKAKWPKAVSSGKWECDQKVAQNKQYCAVVGRLLLVNIELKTEVNEIRGK